MRKYCLKNYRQIPEGQNVEVQHLLVYENSVLQEPIITPDMKATEVHFAAADGASVSLVSRWMETADAAANYSESEPVKFTADGSFDTLSTSLGELTQIGECDAPLTADEQPGGVDIDADWDSEPVIHDRTVEATTTEEVTTTAAPTTSMSPTTTKASTTTKATTTLAPTTTAWPTTTPEPR